MASRFSILIDGGFFTKKFRGENKRFPSAADVVDAVRGIISVCADVEGKELLRVFMVVPKIGSLSSSLLEHSDGTVEIFLKK